MADGGLATTYTLIYTFLKSRSHEKAAVAVKKAAKDANVVILKDGIEETQKGDLNEIIKIWKLKEEERLKKPTANSESSSSESKDSSSDSESSSESDSSNSDSDSDSDSSSSSSSDSSPSPTKASKSSKVGKTNGKPADKSKQSKKSSSDESDNESEKEQRPGIGAKPKLDAKAIPAKEAKPPPSSSSSSSSSEESDSSESSGEASEPKSKPKEKGSKEKAKTVPPPKPEATVKATKKRRLSQSGQAVITAVDKGTPKAPPNQNEKPQANGNKRPRNTPFQRVKAEEVQFFDERLKDNTFMARGGSANDYGAKANQDLIVTRGDSFRKEKNKKKRGSYRGGEITLESHSIKFT